MKKILILPIVGLLCLSFFSVLKPSQALKVSTIPNENALLSQHWVPGWGFRDENNSIDIDYQNFWMDNAGKILMESLITNDTVDASRAFGFIQSHMTQSDYLPEVLVNSSMINNTQGNPSLSNRIVLLEGSNEFQPELEQLSLGDYYASPQLEGFLGADRIFYNESGQGGAYRANSSVVTAVPDGFVKRAFFNFTIPGGARREFYTYLNVTMKVGDPYVQISTQIQPMNSTFEAGNTHGNYTYLQVFAGYNENLKQFSLENATIFNADGTVNRTAPFRGATPQSTGGLVIAYSNRTNVLDQDSVAVRFNATDLYDVEHWYQDGAFDGLSWFGLGYQYNVTVGQGDLSAPVYAEVYPIEHMDYHLMSDMVKYIVSNPPLNVTVSPPVSFGFVAEGLALEAKLNPGNQTIQNLARSYWNLIYSRYNSSIYSTPYGRAINVFTLAGFTLFNGSSTVEDFTRSFVGGDSIEEYGWAVAALHQLYEYTKLPSDLLLYQSYLDSLSAGGPHFVVLVQSSAKNELNPEATFEFGETASGLMLGGVPFNYATVIWAMNAVYQSNVSGMVRNSPFGGDEANTETLPAYILSTWLFENEMRNETGYWITGLENTNVTAIAYSGDTLLIQAVGSKDSNLTIANGGGSHVYTVQGFETIQLPLSVSISPVSVVMDVGQSQLFTSNVSGGVSPYTYQWYLNNRTIPDANSSTWAYIPNETGSYEVFVKVNDSVGTQAISNTVIVKVNAAPSVTASLSSATLDVGQSVTLNSTVSGGTSPYSYQWYLNGTAVKGATSATWTHILISSGSYTVYLKVTDAVSYSAVSNASAVTVNIPPSVTVSPHSAALDTNQSVTFTSSVSGGASPYSYQWYLNGVPVTGATGASWAYTFNSSGSYTVYLEVTDAVSETAISNAAVVNVNVPPSIIVSPSLATLDVSQSVTFTSTVFGGTSPYSCKWYLNGVLQTGTTGTWTFTPTSSGSYSVNVTLTDAVGTITTSNVATVTVNTRPSVTVSPGSVALDAGESQTFTSTVFGGTSPYSYQWYLNGSAVAGVSGSSWTCTFNSPGFYTVNVEVIDGVGAHAKSSPVAITVKTPVSVTTMIEIIIAIIEAVVVATFLVMLRKRKRQ